MRTRVLLGCVLGASLLRSAPVLPPLLAQAPVAQPPQVVPPQRTPPPPVFRSGSRLTLSRSYREKLAQLLGKDA